MKQEDNKFSIAKLTTELEQNSITKEYFLEQVIPLLNQHEKDEYINTIAHKPEYQSVYQKHKHLASEELQKYLP